MRHSSLRHVYSATTLAIVMTVVSTNEAGAQSVDSSPAFPSRSLPELVQALPGTTTALHDLSQAALRYGFVARLAMTTQRMADATALTESRVVDPVATVGSAFGVSSATNDYRRSNSTTAGMRASLPLGTDIGVTFARDANEAPFLAGATGATVVARSMSLSFSQPLLDGFNTRTAEWKAARREGVAAEYTLRRVRDEVASEVERLYWTLAEAEAIEAVYQRSLELSRTILARNVELAARDLIAQGDVLTVRSGVAIREAVLIAARQNRQDLSDALVFTAYGDRATARIESDTLPLKTDARDTVSVFTLPATLEAATRIAIAERADVRAVQELLDAAHMRQVQAHNALKPELSLDGAWSANSYGNGASAQSGLYAPARTWRLGLNIELPVLNRGDRGREQFTAAMFDAVAIRVAAVQNDVRRELREAIRANRLGAEQLRVADFAASLAWEQLQAERKRLDLGLADSFRLLQTEDNAVQAQLQAVRARYDLLRAQTRYRLALGTIVEER